MADACGSGAAARTLDDWLDWLVRIHPKGMDLGLDRVGMVWQRLWRGPLPFPVITVAGTNGKGSCVAMLEAIGEAAGYRTASYTSPHLLRYNERVKLSGQPVADQTLCDAFARVETAREGVALTYFELGTLAALDIFLRARPDLAILEVGLGGRLDAVNIVDSDCAIVTSIGLDHTAWLGESLEEIAREKAGVFRPGRPAIIGQADAPAALRAEAVRLGATPLQLGREIHREMAAAGWLLSIADGSRLALPIPALRGGFQMDNAAAAVAAVQALRGRLPVSASAIRLGLQRAQVAGRFQVIPGAVAMVLDVAHNGDAARALASNLAGFQHDGKVRAVLGVLSDKQPEAIASPLRSLISEWYLTQSSDPRALPVQDLAMRLRGALGDASSQAYESVEDALAAAFAASQPGDTLLVLGSFTTVGQALRYASGT